MSYSSPAPVWGAGGTAPVILYTKSSLQAKAKTGHKRLGTVTRTFHRKKNSDFIVRAALSH